LIVVHHLNHSRSHRILWLLEELELPYEIKSYQRDKKSHLAPPELRKIHPLGKSPVITDGDETIAESAVIMDYLLDQVPESSLRPDRESKAFKRYRYWMHYGESSMMPPLLMSLIFKSLTTSPAPLPIRPIGAFISKAVHSAYLSPELRKHGEWVESELMRSEYFCGAEFTAADIQMGFVLEAFASRHGIEKFPKISKYLQTLKNRAAYLRALEKGGPVILGT